MRKIELVNLSDFQLCMDLWNTSGNARYRVVGIGMYFAGKFRMGIKVISPILGTTLHIYLLN